MAKRRKQKKNAAHKAALRNAMVRAGAFAPGKYATKVRADRRKEASRRACRGKVQR